MFAQLKLIAEAKPVIAAVSICSLTGPTCPNLKVTPTVAGVPLILTVVALIVLGKVALPSAANVAVRRYQQ